MTGDFALYLAFLAANIKISAFPFLVALKICTPLRSGGDDDDEFRENLPDTSWRNHSYQVMVIHKEGGLTSASNIHWLAVPENGPVS